MLTMKLFLPSASFELAQHAQHEAVPSICTFWNWPSTLSMMHIVWLQLIAPLNTMSGHGPDYPRYGMMID